MEQILLNSENNDHLNALAHMVSECGGYRWTRVGGSPAQLLERGASLDAFDILIIDAVAVDANGVANIPALCRDNPHLVCVLLLPKLEPSAVITAMRAGFRDVLSWPLEQRTLAEALSRATSQRPPRQGRDTRMLSFLSCKGGAGTTFIACNVAAALSTLPNQRVLLVDLNQLYGDAAFLLSDQTPASTLPQVCSQITRMDTAFLDACLLHVSETLHVLAGAGDPLKASEISQEKLEWIIGIAAPHYDTIVFDLGQTINALSIFALDRSDEIMTVLQASMPYVRAGRRMQEILASLGFAPDRLRVVVNRYARPQERQLEALEKVLGTRPFAMLPEDATIVAEAINLGVPVQSVARGSSVARALQALAQGLIVGRVTKEPRTRGNTKPLLGRLFARSAEPELKTM
jgi:pilus assembly protein CpaE